MSTPGARPASLCRRPNCSEEAFYPAGFCLTHGLRYLEWRAELDGADLDGVPASGPERAAQLDALDVLYDHLGSEPFG